MTIVFLSVGAYFLMGLLTGFLLCKETHVLNESSGAKNRTYRLARLSIILWPPVLIFMLVYLLGKKLDKVELFLKNWFQNRYGEKK